MSGKWTLRWKEAIIEVQVIENGVMEKTSNYEGGIIWKYNWLDLLSDSIWGTLEF